MEEPATQNVLTQESRGSEFVHFWPWWYTYQLLLGAF